MPIRRIPGALRFMDGDGQNRFGFSADVKPGNEAQGVRNQGAGDQDGQLVTLSLFRENKQKPAEVSDIFITAKISWGIGGASQSAEIDWNHGTMVTVPATSIAVVAQYDSPEGPDDTPAPAPEVKLTSLVAYGTRPGGTTPRLTRRFALAAAAAEAAIETFDVPAFASDVTWLVNGVPADLATIVLRVRTSKAGIVLYSVNASALGRALPLPNSAELLELENTSAAAVSGVLLFGIAL
jgi:hypothetical protein